MLMRVSVTQQPFSTAEPSAPEGRENNSSSSICTSITWSSHWQMIISAHFQSVFIHFSVDQMAGLSLEDKAVLLSVYLCRLLFIKN